MFLTLREKSLREDATLASMPTDEPHALPPFVKTLEDTVAVQAEQIRLLQIRLQSTEVSLCASQAQRSEACAALADFQESTAELWSIVVNSASDGPITAADVLRAAVHITRQGRAEHEDLLRGQELELESFVDNARKEIAVRSSFVPVVWDFC